MFDEHVFGNFLENVKPSLPPRSYPVFGPFCIVVSPPLLPTLLGTPFLRSGAPISLFLLTRVHGRCSEIILRRSETGFVPATAIPVLRDWQRCKNPQRCPTCKKRYLIVLGGRRQRGSCPPRTACSPSGCGGGGIACRVVPCVARCTMAAKVTYHRVRTVPDQSRSPGDRGITRFAERALDLPLRTRDLKLLLDELD